MLIAAVSAASVNFIGFDGVSNEAVRQEILHLTKFFVALESVTPVGSGLGWRLSRVALHHLVRHRQRAGVTVKTLAGGQSF